MSRAHFDFRRFGIPRLFPRRFRAVKIPDQENVVCVERNLNLFLKPHASWRARRKRVPPSARMRPHVESEIYLARTPVTPTDLHRPTSVSSSTYVRAFHLYFRLSYLS